jgi:opacity protein-like surface antigen
MSWKLIWQLMKKLLLAATTTILLSGAAHAAEVQCTPKDNTARILKSANPNDTAPGWKMAIVGTAVTFTVKRTVSAETGKYLQCDLISTRGGTMGRNLFILAQEWDCGS